MRPLRSARAIADHLGEQGFETTILPAERVTSVDGFDAVVLGSAVYAGHWLKAATDLVDRTAPELAIRAGVALLERPDR